ncbi:hypothetical protein EJ110_NYTH46304 [Nymphaea thermarum]|nr:hypothetical protein EJ110_NYTH46304 [Nymphaea thermarum]
MEHFPMKRVSLHQAANVSTVECFPDTSAMGSQDGVHFDPSPDQIIYPEPRRATPALSSLNCCGTPYLKLHREQSSDASVELLDIFLTKSYGDDDDGRSGWTSFFYGSPPARTNNPVVRDARFVNQVSGRPPPWCWNSPGGRPSNRAEKHSPSCSATFGGGKPVVSVRIEGFASGSSESHCIVSAFAC